MMVHLLSVRLTHWADTTTLEAYADWMKGLLTPVPDGNYELKGFAADEARDTVLAFAVFHGTQSGEGGPVPPTGNSVAADYVYAMKFEGDKIRPHDQDLERT